MVKLEEVEDEEYRTTQAGPKDEEDDWDTDSGTAIPPTTILPKPPT